MTKTHKTHDEDKQNNNKNKNTTQKTKKMATAKFWSFLYDTQKHNKT